MDVALWEEAERVAGLGTWSWQVDSGEICWSANARALLGLPPDTPPSNEAYVSAMHPDDRAAFQACAARVREGGEPPEMEHRIVLPDGTVRHVQLRGRMVEGPVRRMIGTILDVTDRRALLDEQRRQNELFVEAQEMAHVGSWHAHPGTGKLWFSREFNRILGLPPDHVATDQDMWEIIHPDDLERVLAHRARAMEEGGVTTVECRVIRADGGVRHLLWHARIHYLSDGTPVFTGVVHDLTERKQLLEAQRRQNELFAEAQALANVGSWHWRPASGTLVYSDELKRILGLEPDEPYDVQLFESLVHPDDRERIHQLRLQAERERVPGTVDCRLLRRDGSVRYVSMLSRAHVLEDGETYFTGAVLDVTERVALEAQLRHAQTLETIGQVTAGIAHDFNNLLTVVLANAGLLAERQPSPEVRAVLDAARSGADLTRRLLAMTRREPLCIEAVDVDGVVSEVARMLQSIVGRTIQVRTRLEARCSARADAQILRHVLLNLGINARDALPSGGNLVIETRRVASEEGAGVRICVRDDGVGMSPDVIERAFEPFFTTKPNGQGSGLGLSMVKSLVEHLDGQVDIHSTEGAGTEVVLFLPHTGEGLGDPPEVERGHVVLVVDDDAAVCSLLARVLVLAGYEVRTAENPACAKAQLARERPDVLVTDVVMPQGGGRGLVAEARGRYPDLPVLLVTSYGVSNEGLEGLPVLRKPFLPKELVTAVAALI